MTKIGCGTWIAFLIGAATMLFIILPASAPVENIPGIPLLYQMALCNQGETIIIEPHIERFPRKIKRTVEFFCVNAAGVRRETLSRLRLIAVVGLGTSLLMGLVLFLMRPRKTEIHSQAAEALLQGYGIPPTENSNPNRVIVSESGERTTVTVLLKDLKNAYDQGLIMEQEYDAKRREILHKM